MPSPASGRTSLATAAGCTCSLPPAGEVVALDYRFGGKRKSLSMGTSPGRGAQGSPGPGDSAREHLAHGADPDVRKAQKAARADRDAESFEAVARSGSQSTPHPLTGRGRYVFPGVRSASRPLSENTVNAALRWLGYAKTEMTGHAFRHGRHDPR